MTRGVAGALPLAAAAALACAQPGSPPGGPEDRSPPRVIEVVPAAFDTLEDLSSPVVIRFDERISERLDGVAEFGDAVLVSPATGEHRVVRRPRSLEIRLPGGWEPDRVYSVVVRPVFRDLFGNRRTEPIELVFSTGAPITESAVAGFVNDRLTGRPAPDARVEARRRIDGTRYVAVADTGGFFAFRFIPAGAYDVRAWLDQNRSGDPDFFEPQDTTAAGLGAPDTMVVELGLLPMDTTPARLARAVHIDSSRVRLEFDDYFAVGPVSGSAALYRAADSSLVTASGRLLHGSRLDSILAAEAAVRDAARAEAARQDSIRRAAAADSAAALGDSAAVRADSVRREAGRDTGRAVGPDTLLRRVRPPGVPVRPARSDQPPGQPGQRGQPGQPGQRPGLQPGQRPGQGAGARSQGVPLPSRELILVLPGVFAPDTEYYVVVEDVTNIRGVRGGGGTASFTTPEAPPDSAGSEGAAADTAGGGAG